MRPVSRTLPFQQRPRAADKGRHAPQHAIEIVERRADDETAPVDAIFPYRRLLHAGMFLDDGNRAFDASRCLGVTQQDHWVGGRFDGIHGTPPNPDQTFVAPNGSKNVELSWRKDFGPPRARPRPAAGSRPVPWHSAFAPRGGPVVAVTAVRSPGFAPRVRNSRAGRPAAPWRGRRRRDRSRIPHRAGSTPRPAAGPC